MAKRLTRKEMELEIRNALELLKGEYLNDTTLNADKFINNEIRKLEELNDSEKILLKDLTVCMMYKTTILDVRDVEIMAYIAEQWFPGKKVAGVQGTDPSKWCGCVIAGSEKFKEPHIHLSISECMLVNSGDWIVTDKQGKRCLVEPAIFDHIYEKT